LEGYLKVEFRKPLKKKQQNYEDFRILVLFSDPQNLTSSYPYRPCKLQPLFLPSCSHIDLKSSRQKNIKS
jgi:hypothetical protein